MCLPSCDLSYFCSVSRGRNSPSINISIVISAGRPRVAFRKMSWNWFLTFISQSGWGLLLARRVFTHPTHETILEVRGYSLSAQGLAQFLCDLIATLGKKHCANELFPLVTQVSPPHGDGWQMGMSSSFNRYVWRWEPPCLMSHVLDALPCQWPPTKKGLGEWTWVMLMQACSWDGDCRYWISWGDALGSPFSFSLSSACLCTPCGACRALTPFLLRCFPLSLLHLPAKQPSELQQ